MAEKEDGTMTREQIEALKALAMAATAGDLDTVNSPPDEYGGKEGPQYYECPACGGDGEVDGVTYTNFDHCAMGVQFFGIGVEFGKYEAFFRGWSPANVLKFLAAYEAMEAENKALREALGDCVETLALSEPAPTPDPVFHDRVKALGREVGFGAMMRTAERGWREVLEESGYPVGGEHTAGACRTTVEDTLRRARKALGAE